MTEKDKHIEPNKDTFFQEIGIPFKDSKEDLWDSLSNNLSDVPKGRVNVITMSWFRTSAAAIVILLISSILFINLYTTTIQTTKGTHLSHILPDGSSVLLNAESQLSYRPYWWKFNRELSFEGEGFFEVEKGKKFSVISSNGQTQVLGTSFNIYARHKDYSVFCSTGKVKVSSTTNNVELIIKSGEMAILDNINKLGQIENAQLEQVASWKNHQFNFKSVSLEYVFEELARQYNVDIILKIKSPDTYMYTGNFNKTSSVENSIDLICQTFDITFVKLRNNQYQVLPKHN